MTRFCLSWNSHPSNISTGLSSLQQNGEFVDMTLAADGHLVKVHQVIIALASPYLKGLINSAPCPHPVIFLHNISSTTLCNILEYIYTGEAVVSLENINNLLEAGKNLHIKGLDSLNIQDLCKENSSENSLKQTIYKETSYEEDDSMDNVHNTIDTKSYAKIMETESLLSKKDSETEMVQEILSGSEEQETVPSDTLTNLTTLKYTVSNQGSLQVILNRFIYYLKHSNKNSLRQWRCVDYITSVRCPAYIMTCGDIVTKRAKAHIHPYHDDKIYKKVNIGSIYSSLKEASNHGKSKKKRKLSAKPVPYELNLKID